MLKINSDLLSIIRFFCAGLFFASPAAASAPLWSGYLSAGRGIDWQGMVFTPPDTSSWTQCGATIPAYTGTADTINTAINACGPNQYVLLGPGTFNLTTAITTNSRSNFILRGSGPMSTTIVSSAASGCTQTPSAICLMGSPGFLGCPTCITSIPITAGAAQGSTSITLGSVAGLSVGQIVMPYQNNEDLAFSTAPFISGAAGYTGGGPPEGTIDGTNGTFQLVKITGITGNTITIDRPLYYLRWSQSLNPQVGVMFGGAFAQNVGVENMTVTAAGSVAWGTIQITGLDGAWVQNVRFNQCVSEACLDIRQSRRVSIFNNYFYHEPSGTSIRYTVAGCCSSDIAVYNNICQQLGPCYLSNGAVSGAVVAYNFSINEVYNGTGFNNLSFYPDHSLGSIYILLEGNDSNGLGFDLNHGTSCCNVVVRNYFDGRGYDLSLLTATNTTPLINRAYNRWDSLLGNVFGIAGYHTIYQGYPAAPSVDIDRTIYDIGFCGAGQSSGCGTPNNADETTFTSLYRWGNFDVVTNGARFDPAEVPADQIAPGNQSVPNSFYLTAKPAWFGAAAWPPIGPDISGGTAKDVLGQTQNHANRIPARVCYENMMQGPANGSGAVLAFDANDCYGSGSNTVPAKPSGLALK